MTHVRELAKMGAQITLEASTATIRGVERLYGGSVIATDIRAAAGLVIAGLSAEGITYLSGLHHLTRGYVGLDVKLRVLGAKIGEHPSIHPLSLEASGETRDERN